MEHDAPKGILSPTYQGAVKNANTGRGVFLPRTLLVNCSAVSINLPPDLVICRALLIRETLACGPTKALVVDDSIPKRSKNKVMGDFIDFILWAIRFFGRGEVRDRWRVVLVESPNLKISFLSLDSDEQFKVA
jgi:hypothetical protein